MRTVRGMDFDDLTVDELRAISGWLRQQPISIPPPSPYPYQVKALFDIAETLTRSDRAQVVMACGTGKTLVALWAVEQLKPRTVLVLVPSLTLLQQTLDEWSRHNSWGKDFTYLCVRSDPTVASKDEYDPIDLSKMDLEFRVDTNPDEVRRFTERDTSNIKVVFSTYHSSPVVSEGVRGLTPFDVGIFDEAHKTTGPRGGSFAHALFPENIGIHKRLFFTATPRHYDIRHRNREGDFKIQSMDDPTVYGPRAYTLTFGSAARQSIICNYKVVISVVDGQEVNDFALKYGITLVQGDLIGAKWVANQIAIERAVETTGSEHVITFHSRVSSAKEFSTDTSRGIRQFLPDFSVYHVNGSQHSSERKQIIRAFRDANKSLITNARCLTEGVDLPAVDMIAFIDPRHSRIDIAQATGRAMRKPLGSDKTIGYIVVPLFLERKGEETLETALERSDFSDVADVLNALQEQDEDLIAIVRELQEAKGRGEVFNPRRLAEKVEVLGPTVDLSLLKSNIFAEIVERIGVSWDQWFGRLKAYKDREGHCRVPALHKENGLRLGSWVDRQRQTKDRLSAARRQRLDEIGFDWNPHDTYWEIGFDHLQRYFQREGHCLVPRGHKEDSYALGDWVSAQRAKKEQMDSERRQRLDNLGFVWDARDAGWDEGYGHLQRYFQREGHCLVPRGHKPNGYALDQWVSVQRAKRDKLSLERQQKLDELGFIWDTREAAWEKGYCRLRSFNEREGHCRVPVSYRERDGYALGQWVNNQRARKDSLPENRRNKLNDINFVWNPYDEDWEIGFSHLEHFRAHEGHCDVPQAYKANNGFLLGQWVSVQRLSKASLSQDRMRRLDELGFIWHSRQSLWDKGCSRLRLYKEREGHCRVPVDYTDNDGFRLGKWVFKQRQKRKSLSGNRLQKLEQLGFDWSPRESAFEEGLHHLKSFKVREGHCRVPVAHIEGDYALGRWVNRQRTGKDRMSPEHRRQLDAIRFVWKVR